MRAQWVVDEVDYAKAKAILPQGLEANEASSPAMHGVTFISITQQGISKGSAVKDLCEYLKVDPKSTMGVGDSTGDEPMLKAVAHARVMANSPTILKECYISIGDVADCGVVEALQEALKLA
ncbi:MAG: HAD-IIB family hydrolase [Deinococcales bacterium]